MSLEEVSQLARFAIALLLAVGSALLVDFLSRRRGFDPPGFELPGRRGLATSLLAFVFLIGVFVPLTHVDQPPDVDVESLGLGAVFLLHGIFVATLGAWLALGYLGVERRPAEAVDPQAAGPEEAVFEKTVFERTVFEKAVVARENPADWPRRLGLVCDDPLRELALGLGAGLIAWVVVLTTAAAAAMLLAAFGADGILSGAPPEVIVWMAALPVGVRLAISASAGLVEELFFRGFLQLRIGIGLSSLLFVCGHLSYGQPFMLVGLTVLSLFYGWLVRWRRNIWSAVAAHFLFDAVQLLVFIPFALELSERGTTLSLLALF